MSKASRNPGLACASSPAARGNVTESITALDATDARIRTTTTAYPDSTNAAVTLTINGLPVRNTGKDSLIYRQGYDALGRQVASQAPDGGIASQGYNTAGQVAWSTDAATNGTWFGFDNLGRRTAVTNALGQVTSTAFDAKGQPLATWGATYPVRYGYSDAGRMTNMWTYRGNAAITSYQSILDLEGSMDRTRWLYEDATGLLTNKLYADSKGPVYAYTADGKLATRAWARGVTTSYAQDLSGALTNISYSDSTPAVLFAYDRYGRQTSTIAAGVSTNLYVYDNYGTLTNEVISLTSDICPLISDLSRPADALGRSAGYELSQQGSWLAGVQYQFDNTGNFSNLSWSNALDAAGGTVNYTRQNGRIVSRTVQRGSGPVLTTAWTHDIRGLVVSLSNTVSNCVSHCQYSNDPLGRRTAVSRSGSAYTLSFTDRYGYNNRSEVTSTYGYLGENADSNAPAYPDRAFEYAFDPIGNRITSTVRNPANEARTATYTANALNQYTQRTVPGYAVLAGTAATHGHGQQSAGLAAEPGVPRRGDSDQHRAAGVAADVGHGRGAGADHQRSGQRQRRHRPCVRRSNARGVHAR
ncbi:MAG: hypothetical protein WCR06_09505 [bacterium]